MPTETWGDFEVFLDKMLGRGGMGAVYVGRQISLDRPVAVKVLKKELGDDPDFVKRFHREAALLAKLIHPHVVQVFMAGEHQGQQFFAMELVEGEDLFSALKRGHRYSPDEVIRIAYETAQALHAGWKHKIVHRDIKPSNIIMTREHQIKVMDFGLAKSPGSADITAPEGIVGTAKYMSPEQGTGSPIDIRTDLYSLGVVIYELATGLPPFTGDNPTAIVYQHVHKDPPPPRAVNPSVPPELEAVILKLMAKRPEDRYQAPEELARHCRTLLDRRRVEGDGDTVKRMNPSSQVTAIQPPPAPVEEKSSHVGLILTLLLAFGVIGAGGWYAWKKLNQETPTPPEPPKPRPTASIGKVLAQIDPAPEPKDAPEDEEARRKAEEEKRKAEEERRKREEEERLARERAERARGALAKGDEALARGDWAEALGHFEEAEKAGADLGDRRSRVSVAKGDDAFAKKKWAEAIAAWKEANRPELKDKLDRADLELTLEGAAAEADPSKKVEIYLANLARDEARIRPLLRGAAFEHGKSLMGKDWPAAAKAFALAIEHEPDAVEKKLLEKRKDFCEKVHLEERAEKEEQWDLARETLIDLLGGEVYEFRAALQTRLKAVEAKIAAGMSTEDKKEQERFQKLCAEGRAHFEKGEWAKAHAKMEEAGNQIFRRFHDVDFRKDQKRCRQAANPPSGMVYVPGGTYTIGEVSERSLHGPTWEIDLAPYYIDVQEVASADYRDFVDDVAKNGHAKCHKDEPRGLTHEPERPSRDGPVVWVTYWDAHAFAAWKGKRLPTEAEFEVAAGYDCKDRRRRTYPWGEAFARGTGDSFFGLQGLDNRILEWTASEYQPYPKSRYEDDRFGPDRGILRGGFKTTPDKESLKATFRHWMLRKQAQLYTGFRCVQDVPEK